MIAIIIIIIIGMCLILDLSVIGQYFFIGFVTGCLVGLVKILLFGSKRWKK